ncbi:MAG: hypothetical protein IPI35_23335 [Deltaproteobacteria bacterium]|nr:hypothetical protein [Deltaproteobacteria bacterium]
MANGDFKLAHSAFNESLSLYRTLVQQRPESTDAQWKLARSLRHSGDLAATLGDLTAAQAAYDESLGLLRGLQQQDQLDPQTPISSPA